MIKTVFNLLANINFHNFSVNLTDIVPNIQDNRVNIIFSKDIYMPEIYETNNQTIINNCGIPLCTNYTIIGNKIIDKLNNTPFNYSDYIVFDMESWSPVWNMTNSLYQNLTIDYIQKMNPNLFPNKNNSELLLRSKEAWELHAMEVMLWPISVIRINYPLAKVGYYGYPGMPYWCDGPISCPQYRLYNNQLQELWSQVDVLLPSIYMPYNSTGNLEIVMNNMMYVKRKIDESSRIKKLHDNVKEIIPYTWHRYHDPPNDLILYNEFNIQYMYTYKFEEVDGLILWSNEGSVDWKNETIWWFAEYSCMFEELV